jgi:hypothetical protein
VPLYFDLPQIWKRTVLDVIRYNLLVLVLSLDPESEHTTLLAGAETLGLQLPRTRVWQLASFQERLRYTFASTRAVQRLSSLSSNALNPNQLRLHYNSGCYRQR